MSRRCIAQRLADEIGRIARCRASGFVALILAAGICLSLSFTASSAADRIALVIGNAKYDRPELMLANPGNDAAALAAVLRKIGFAVDEVHDANRIAMTSAVDKLAHDAMGANTVFVFYAGHGVQVGGENYLIPTDFSGSTPRDVAAASLTLRDIRIALAKTGATLSVVVLDACRNNPLAKAGLVSSGLSPVRGGAGMLIAYATDPGNTAADGTGDHSAFTTALLRNIETPGLDVRLMFGRVRQEVVLRSGGAQIPWVEEAVLGEHSLVDASQPAISQDDEYSAWRSAETAGTVTDLRNFIAKYPNGVFAGIAQSRIEELTASAAQGHAAALEPVQIAQASAALELLGLLSPSRGLRQTDQSKIESAFEIWRERDARRNKGFEDLMGQGAQMALLLGTYTAAILRKDLQNFVAMEKNLGLAEADLARARARFGDSPDARETLDAMTRDVDEIHRLRDQMAAHLDASRSYYGDLVQLTETELKDWIPRETLPGFGGTRELSGDVPVRVLSDVRTFLKHVDLAASKPRGSYAWLAELVQEEEQ